MKNPTWKKYHKREKHICEGKPGCRSWATEWYDDRKQWICRAHAVAAGLVDDGPRIEAMRTTFRNKARQIRTLMKHLEGDVMAGKAARMTHEEFLEMRDRLMDILLLKRALKGSDVALKIHYSRKGVQPDLRVSMKRIEQEAQPAKAKRKEEPKKRASGAEARARKFGSVDPMVTADGFETKVLPIEGVTPQGAEDLRETADQDGGEHPEETSPPLPAVSE
jgi:hypothetical protein